MARIRPLIFVGALLVVAACNETRNPLVGTPAPDAKLTPASPSGDVKLSSLKGKVVLLDFWATWCGPCRQLMPIINQLNEKYKDKGLVVMGVSTEDAEIVRAFRLNHPEVKYDLYLDHNGDASDAYKAYNLPTTVLIGRDGKVTYWDAGLGPNTPATLDQEVQSALDRS